MLSTLFNVISSATFLVLVFLFFFATPAFAYIDPGSGSYALQFVIGGLIGSLILFRGHIKKFKSFFTKSPQKKLNSKDED